MQSVPLPWRTTTNGSPSVPEMPNPLGIRSRLLFAFCRPKRAILLGLVLAVAAGLSWYGVKTWRYNRALHAAEQALSEYDFPAARDHLRQCAELRPNEPQIWLLAAQAARRDADHGAAAEHLATYRRLTGHTTPEGLLEETLLQAARGPTSDVIDYLITLADHRHPALEQILEALAVGSIEIYHLDRARFWLGQLLSRFPRNPVGRLLRIQMDATLARRERAIEECRQLLAEFPSFHRAELFLASMLVSQQNYQEAAEHFDSLRKRRPDDVDALLGLATCLERMGRLNDARPLMKELEEKRPDNTDVLLQLGRFAIREQRWADAERYLARGLQLTPNNYDMHKEIAVCLYQLGRDEEAQRHAERNRQIEADRNKLEKIVLEVIKTPRDPAPRVEAGRLCLKNGQSAEAFRWLYGALEMAPDNKATHRALADYFTTVGNTERAEYHRALGK